MTRRIILGLVTGMTVFGAVFAMAASLGGISGAKLGADDAVVASCDTDGVTSAYTSAWDTTDKRYEVSAATVGGVNDACDGQTLKVTLIDSTGASLGEGSLALPSSTAVSFSVTVTPGASAKAVTGVHVSIA